MSSKQSLFLSMITLLTVMTWIIFDVYHAFQVSTIKPLDQKLMKALDSKLETDVFLKLGNQ